MIPLIGYTNTLSSRPGETIEVKVSSTAVDPYRAELVHVISGDPNPDGPGMDLRPVPSPIDGEYPSRPQQTHLGSHMEASLSAPLPETFRLDATIFPTTPDKGPQGVITLHHMGDDDGVILGIGPEGVFCKTGSSVIATGAPLPAYNWAKIWAEVDTAVGTVTVGQSIEKLDHIAEKTNASVALEKASAIMFWSRQSRPMIPPRILMARSNTRVCRPGARLLPPGIFPRT